MSHPTEDALRAARAAQERAKRPDEFCERCVTARNTPYQIEDRDDVRKAPQGGVLPTGTAVWTRQRPQDADLRIVAYVEGIGVISVEARDFRQPC